MFWEKFVQSPLFSDHAFSVAPPNFRVIGGARDIEMEPQNLKEATVVHIPSPIRAN